jgi:hypothetical protein
MKPLATALLIGLSGCASSSLPPELEGSKSFEQTSTLPYQEAYRIISRQMRVCFEKVGAGGKNGYDVVSNIDASGRQATINAFFYGVFSGPNPENSSLSRKVTLTPDGTGSTIVTSGGVPKNAYETHLSIRSWLSGVQTCNPTGR